MKIKKKKLKKITNALQNVHLQLIELKKDYNELLLENRGLRQENTRLHEKVFKKAGVGIDSKLCRWILGESEMFYKCSFCGGLVTKSDRYLYCPHCGRKVEGERV